MKYHYKMQKCIILHTNLATKQSCFFFFVFLNEVFKIMKTQKTWLLRKKKKWHFWDYSADNWLD